MSTSFKQGDIVHYANGGKASDHDWEVLTVVEVPDIPKGSATACGATYLYLIPVAQPTDWAHERYSNPTVFLNITDGVSGWSLVRPDVITFRNIWMDTKGNTELGVQCATLAAAQSFISPMRGDGFRVALLKINKTQRTVEVVK